MTAAQIGNLQVRMGIDSAEFSNGVRAIQGSLGSLTGSLKAFATAAAATAVFNSTVAAVKAVAELGDVAESIGVSAEQLQVFQRLALASGTSTDVMTRGLQSIAEQSVDTNSKLSQLFTANGLTMAGKTMNEIILNFMELLKNARTPAEQLAIATDVLGTKVGRQLVESLRAGSEGWQEEFETMRGSGNYLANESVKDAQRIETAYNQTVTSISTAWQRMVVAMVSGASEIVTALEPITNPDFSKPTAAGELWRYLTGGKTTPGFAESPGFLSKPEAVNMGPMGGPGQFPIVPAKVTVLPLDPPEKTKITKQIQTAVDAGVYIPPNTIDDIYGAGEAIQSFQSDMVGIIPEATALSDAFDGISESISNGLVNAIQGLVSGSMNAKDAFASMANSISQQLADISAELLKSGLFRILSLALAGPGGAGVSLGGSLFGGLFANGGTLGAGKWGIAGEAGPEIVHGPATITPMSKMGGQTSVSWSPSIVINGSADQRMISSVMAAEREKFKADLPKMIRDARKRGSI